MDNENFGFFRQQLFEMADATRALLVSEKQALKQLEKIVKENDVVFGVFPDANSADGAEVYLIKGRRRLQSVAADAPNGAIPIFAAGAKMKTTAIPCIDYEQAVVARQFWGDPE